MNNDPPPPTQSEAPSLMRRLRNHLTSEVQAWAVYLAFIVAVSGPFAARAVDNHTASTREADLADAVVRACRQDNGFARALRDQSMRDADSIEQSLLELGVDQAPIDTLVNRLRAGIPPASETDVDCNGDGQLDPRDYPITRNVDP